MSDAPKPRASVFVRFQQLFLLAMVFALLWGATHAVPDAGGGLSAVAAVGFLLLAGTLGSELLELFKLPHLTGYILAGVVAGPHVLNLIDHETVQQVSKGNTLALALIALAGGAELRIEELRAGARSLAWATLTQSLLVFLAAGAIFGALTPVLPFMRGQAWTMVLGMSLLWGAIAVTRSPSATLGVLAQTRARGPIAQSTLATVMTSNVVVLVMVAMMLTLTKPLVEPGSSLSLGAFRDLGRALLGSISLGTTLGLLLVMYLRFVNRSLLLVLLLLGFGFTEIVGYLRFEPLLTFLVAGFIVQNLSTQGEKFVRGIEGLGSMVYVVFFACAGAHLDVPILRQLWPIALLLCGSRALSTIWAHRLGSRLAGDPPAVRKWGWAGLVAQAGMSLGVGSILERNVPSIGGDIRALIIATVAINEVVGPVLFKLALDRNGESRSEAVLPHGASDEPMRLDDNAVPQP